MDLQMPVMDGVDAVRLIRAHEVTHALSPSLIYMGAPRTSSSTGVRAHLRRLRSLRSEL
jgi:CheY-like chemotaxis protein